MPKPISATSIWFSPLAGVSLCSVIGLVVAWSSLDAAGPEQGLELLEQELDSGSRPGMVKPNRAQGRLLKLMIANRQPEDTIALPIQPTEGSRYTVAAAPPVELAEAVPSMPVEPEVPVDDSTGPRPD